MTYSAGNRAAGNLSFRGGLTDGDRPVMGFRKRIIGSGVALALAGATVFTAGSSHAAVRSTVRSTTARQAGVITWAMSPGAGPNWIFPVVPAAANSVFNIMSFQWNMWRPLYWTDNGTEPSVNTAMSIAAKPVYSNGDKTVTIKLKSGYKWSDGTAVTAKDILFFIDLVKAGLKESPATWAGYTPGFFPDNLAATSQPNTTTLVLKLKSAVNRGFDHIVSQLYFRQAMAHLQDQQGWISKFMHGAGAPSYGPIPAVPASPYLPAVAKTNPYPFSVADAVTLLATHGWTVHPGGTDVCARPGTAATECGAGIAAGTKLAFNFIYNSGSAIITQQARDLVSKASQAGIKITLSASNFNYMISNYLDPYSPANENKWAMMDFGGETDSAYPTTFSLFNTNGPNQIGDYSNPTADALIRASITSRNPSAVKNEAAFLTRNQPVLFQPNEDYVWAWKKNISGTAASFRSLTQYFANPEFWSLTG